MSNSSAAGAMPAAHGPARSTFLQLLPLTLAVFVGFFMIGLPMPVLPLYVDGTLALGALAVGVVAGLQFAAALLSRASAGAMADRRGAKRAVVGGFMLGSIAGLFYLLADDLSARPQAALAALLAGRAVMGCAESLIVTGVLSWGVGRVGPQNAGRVMAWVGVAIYAAYALGAPAGMRLYGVSGFAGIAWATVLIPLAALALVLPQRGVRVTGGTRTPFYRVLGMVWLPGLGLALSSVGFGVITGFVSLFFAERGWDGAAWMFTVFGVGFILARVFFAGLPDKLGGARVALVCVLIEAAGQALIWAGGTPAWAFAGALLTGAGYSLAFPAFGVEAVRRVPAASRGAAMGAYVAFLDVALGLGSPAAGWLAGLHGYAAVYVLGGACALAAMVVGMALRGKA
ncbi:MFS transporter [Achromobacter deleyi]|uniref:MFS transporter n=1 Tax=Achromobacter deleyi TaxID=1353891 RepID=UPI001490CFE2|nr:MFS transporter [Achromobacter deleyi]QVQ25410.1 arabinose transporter [Achromobacter deleyi]UIP20952.1 MFS transporter [Achromobacter deleyi]